MNSTLFSNSSTPVREIVYPPQIITIFYVLATIFGILSFLLVFYILFYLFKKCKKKEEKTYPKRNSIVSMIIIEGEEKEEEI